MVTGMSDQLVVTIRPASPADQLDISEAFQQVLDYLKLVELAASEDADFHWKLASASTNSPFTVVAATPIGSVATKKQQSLDVAQRRAEEGLKDLANGRVPSWMRKRQRNTVRRISRRLTSGIGSMELRASEKSRAFQFSRNLARKALSTLEKVDGFEEISVPSHTAFGETEGTLLGAGSYYGKPALWMRVNGYDVVRCIVGQDKLDELGDEATLKELWKNRRVQVVGTLSYAAGGILEQIAAEEMRLFPASAIELRDVLDPCFTGGMEPIEYLERLHSGDLH